jgi:3-hydroxyisobutyrate dehydrogenase-like beta-hydroxyacid dehydrogenase
MVEQRIGVIGLGLMGGAISTVLLSQGFSLMVFDVDPEKIRALEGKGALAAGSPAEVAASSDVLCTSLPNGTILRDVFLGSGEALTQMAPGSVIVDFSTTEPAAITDLLAAALPGGVEVADAPVSGGPADILKQELVILFGGSDAAYQKAELVLQTLSGGRIHRVGPVGAARVVKLVNNTMTMGNVLVAAEAFTMGVQAGVDPKTLFDVLSNSGGRSHHFLKRFPHALQRDFAARFSMDMGLKDLRLALGLGQQVESPMPVAGLGAQLYAAAAAEGLGSQDFVAILRLFEEWAGVEADARED